MSSNRCKVVFPIIPWRACGSIFFSFYFFAGVEFVIRHAGGPFHSRSGVYCTYANGEAYPDGFASCSAPHHSRSSVPHTMTGGNGEVDLDGFPSYSVPYVAMDAKIVCGWRRCGRGKKYGAHGLIAATCTRWPVVNCSVEAQGILFIAHLPSRAVLAGACHKSPLHQRHLFLQKHRCLRKTQRLHHFRILHQRHQCSRRARNLHHPMYPSLRQSGTTLVRRWSVHNWYIFLVHAGCCRRPGLGRNTGLLCFCCAMMGCCRRPGRDRNTGLPIRWCCFWLPSRAGYKYGAGFARQRQPSCRNCCPSSTTPTSASTSWEVSGRTAQALATSQSGSCAPTVSPPFALASAVSSRVGGTGRTHFNKGGTGLDDVTGRMHLSSRGNFAGFLIEGHCWLGGLCGVCRPSCLRPGGAVVRLDLFLFALVCPASRCCRLLRLCQCSRFCLHLLSWFAAVPGGVQIRVSEHDKKGGTLF